MERGLIGEKLSHSFSKEIHESYMDYEYELFEIKKDDIDSFMKKREFLAINVTIPYKEAVIPYLDEIKDEARNIGAVNTVVKKDGKLIGYNTDFYGMRALIKREKIEVKDKKVLILGSGGTSKTALWVAKDLGAKEIIRVSRTKKEGFITYDEISNCYDADVIINTTPVGMYPDTDKMPIDIEKFTNLSGVVDAIYNPLSTKLITAAKEKGIKATGGLYMLVAQAYRAMEIFNDIKIPLSDWEKGYEKILKSKENVVLVGMPGCGKSTIGKVLAKNLGKAFFDSDEEIKNLTGKTPAEIITQKGEAKFREVEKEVIKTLSDKTGAVIATGGGAVLFEENIKNLKKNGRIVFLDRELGEIEPTKDRPLSSDFELLKKRYEERYPIYKAVSDICVKAKTIEETAREIGELL